MDTNFQPYQGLSLTQIPRGWQENNNIIIIIIIIS